MAIGSRFAVLCSEVIADTTHRAAVAEKLRATGHEVIDISRGQMHRFAGNLFGNSQRRLGTSLPCRRPPGAVLIPRNAGSSRVTAAWWRPDIRSSNAWAAAGFAACWRKSNLPKR